MLHDLVEIVAFGAQVAEHFGVFAVAHPEVVVDARLAVLGDLFGVFGGKREGWHAILHLELHLCVQSARQAGEFSDFADGDGCATGKYCSWL